MISQLRMFDQQYQSLQKLIKLRKRHLIVKQRLYLSFGIQYRLHLHFSFMERSDRLRFKDMTIVNKRS